MGLATKARNGLPAGADGKERIAVSPELDGLLELALKGARGDGVPIYVLQALQEALQEAFASVPDRSLKANPPPPWEPTPEQIWNAKMKRSDGKRLSAWRRFQSGFGDIPFEKRPYAHQVRQHPKTKDLYDSLCVFVSRNKSKGLSPSSIAELFPMTDEARGGVLAKQRVES